MKLKKWIRKLTLAGILVASILPNSNPASAATGWQTLASDVNFTLYNSDIHTTKTYESGGGYMRWCVRNVGYDNHWRIRLYESDGYGNPIKDMNDYWVEFDGPGCLEVYTSDDVDGINGKAEVFAEIGMANYTEPATYSVYD